MNRQERKAARAVRIQEMVTDWESKCHVHPWAPHFQDLADAITEDVGVPVVVMSHPGSHPGTYNIIAYEVPVPTLAQPR